MADAHTAPATAEPAPTSTPDASADATPPTIMQRLVVEALGTAVLLFVGFGVYIFRGGEGIQAAFTGNPIRVAVAFGITWAALSFAFGRISGAHFNPAVSVGAALAGRLTFVDAALYAAAQLVGAIVGGGLLFLIDLGRTRPDHALPANTFGDKSALGYPWWAVLILELILTLVLVMLFLGVTDSRANVGLAPVLVGMSLAVIYLVSVPADGGGENPVKSLVAAIFEGTQTLKQVWVFFLVPFVGAAIAGVGYPLVFGKSGQEVPGAGLDLTRRPKPVAPAYPGVGGYAPVAGGYPAAGGYPTPAGAYPPAAGGYPPAGYPQQAAPQPAPQVAQPYVQPVAQQPAVQQAVAQPVGEAQPAQSAQSWEPEPIIQDGWQWDYAAQEWKPLDPAAHAAAEAAKSQDQWGGQPDDGRTQIRP